MGTSYLPVPVHGSTSNWDTWLNAVVSSVDDRVKFFELIGFVSAEAAGILPNTGTDSRAAIQTLMDDCFNNGKRGIIFGPGIWDHKSVGYNIAVGIYPSTTMGLWNRGVSMYGEPGRTIFRQTGTASNIIEILADFSTTAVATIVDANIPALTKTFTVDDTTGGGAAGAGFTTGDLVAQRITQNASDVQEARQAVTATVTVNSSTSLTTNRANPWPLVLGATVAASRRFTKITNLPSDITIHGIEFQGDASTRHAIGLQWAARVTVSKCIGDNVGSGLVNAQFAQGDTRIIDCYIRKCGAFANTSKGRGISVSNMDSILIENCRFDDCEGAEIYLESYCQNVQIKNVHIVNNLASRSQPYSIFWGWDVGGSIENILWEGSGTTLASNITYGTGPGIAQIRNATFMLPLSAVRQFPVGHCSGTIRFFDANSVLRTYNTDLMESHYEELDLNTAKALTQPQALYYRNGLVYAVEIVVSAGVDTTMITNITVGRTSVSGLTLQSQWVAGSMVRIPMWSGGVIFPANSSPEQSVKVNVTIGNVTIPAGAIVGVRVYTIAYSGQQIAISEPGSISLNRFRTA